MNTETPESIYPFPSDQQAIFYQHLVKKLRCVVCQNQNLADSDAPIALDIKQMLHDKIILGENEETILQFMTQRYGDFVLYDPPQHKGTALLWLAPLLFLVAGCLFLRKYLSPRGA